MAGLYPRLSQHESYFAMLLSTVRDIECPKEESSRDVDDERPTRKRLFVGLLVAKKKFLDRRVPRQRQPGGYDSGF